MRGVEKEEVKKANEEKEEGREEREEEEEEGKKRGGGREALTREMSVSLCSLGRGSWLQICGSGSHTVCGTVSRLPPAPQTPQTVSVCECV